MSNAELVLGDEQAVSFTVHSDAHGRVIQSFDNGVSEAVVILPRQAIPTLIEELQYALTMLVEEVRGG